MGRVKAYYHDLIGGEFENAPAEYAMTAQEMAEFKLAVDLESVNFELQEAASLDKQDQENA